MKRNILWNNPNVAEKLSIDNGLLGKIRLVVEWAMALTIKRLSSNIRRKKYPRGSLVSVENP